MQSHENEYAKFLLDTKLNKAIGLLFYVLFTLFVKDNIRDSMVKDSTKMTKFLFPVTITYAMYYLFAYTPSFSDERMVITLLLNFILANVSY